AEVLRTLLMNVVTNPVQSLVSANYIGILVWAVLIGIALRKASDTTKQSLNDISAALSKTVTWIIQCAPFGIMGLVYNTVSVNGLSTFTEY
ncbi:cation:dicarboxylase symporter family transporter, partial [Escherichia coli]|nr:cation:dicarboxylase symporter family transporter [Escherichia coli]